jgi:DNA-binding MurR/RpiR family transcriptional regulator
MSHPVTFNDRLDARFDNISPAEQNVARFFQDNREEVLIASASSLAKQSGTSDATVVRTAKSLGFSGLDELRRVLASEMRENTSPAARMARTISDVGDEVETALAQTLDINQSSLERLKKDISPKLFKDTVKLLVDAQRVFIFGIGPSSAMANYLSIELGRLGLDTVSLTQTGLLLADEIQRFKQGDLLIIFAYGRVYQELNVLLDQADFHEMPKILISDTLISKLHHRVNITLPVARGRINMLSMHTATLALIEALLVGVAIKQPKESLASLENLNQIRSALSGQSMDIPAP